MSIQEHETAYMVSKPEIKEQLRDIFGENGFSTDEGVLSSYGYALSGTFRYPSAVVYPKNLKHLQKLLRSARKNCWALYPISKGKNFGYGAAQGTENGQIIIDFRDMNGILEVNEPLAYASLEPGVSQEQLFNYLQDRNIGLQMDITGAGRSSSIVGNVLERGFGHTDYGNRFNSILGMEVLLPDGTLLQTGFGGYPNAQALTYRHGMGPSIDGLFTQSNFGIVTKLRLALQPRPAYTEMMVFVGYDDKSLEQLVLALRRLRLHGYISGTVHIANKERLAKPGLPNKAGPWNVSTALSGDTSYVRVKKKRIKRAFAKIGIKGKLVFMNERKLRWAGLIHKHIWRIPVYPMLIEAFNLKKGIPTDAYLQDLIQDRQATSETFKTSAKEKCFKWISAVTPAEPDAVRKLVHLTEDCLKQAGYPCRITLTFIDPRSLIMISEINYPNDYDSIKRAAETYEKTVAVLAGEGYFAYRSGPGNYKTVIPKDLPLFGLMRTIKQLIDPEGILAPGKYRI